MEILLVCDFGVINFFLFEPYSLLKNRFFMLKQLKLSTRSARLSTQTPLVTNHKAPILYDNHQRHSLDSTLFAKTIDVWIQSTAAKNIGEPIGIMQVLFGLITGISL